MKKPFSLIVLLLLLLVGCQPALHYPAENENNINLNSLTTLDVGENIIYLQDFILNTALIDSITSSSNYLKLSLTTDKKIALATVFPEMETFVDVQVWIDSVPYSIPCRKTDKIDYLFTFHSQGKKYKRIQISGQMNDWVPEMTPDLQLNDSGYYQVKLHLSPGIYFYQLVVDNKSIPDPNNPLKVDNGGGNFNSILRVEGNEKFFPVLYTEEFSNNKIKLAYRNKVKDVFVYWQNYRLPSLFIKKNEDKIIFDIPREAFVVNRSFLRIWASNELGVSNDILIPLQNGKVVTDAKDINRFDKQAQIIYFLLVDRFKNGNSKNDFPLNRPDVHPKVDFQGGDLAGVQQKIEDQYFNQLGINTLWISPLNQNPTEPYGYYAPAKTKFSGYHGYWPVLSSKVDFCFGSNDEFKNLVTLAHENELNILLDYVAHHVHEEHPLYKAYPEFFTSLYLPDGSLNVARWNDQRLTTWFDTFMPTLNTKSPTVINMMTDSALFWIKEFNLDGFRHDACKHISEDFWRALTLKIKIQNHGKNLYQIGETYGSPKLISSFLSTGMLDGQFDFNVFDEATFTFTGIAGNDMQRLSDILQMSLKEYGNHNLMGYISGNHDRPRFMAYASGDLKFGEDTKLAGWKRDIGITDSTAYDKLFLMHVFNFTIPGIPVIYYGDEIGMTGANDPDCRRMMYFDNWNRREKNLWQQVSTLTHLRTSHPVFLYGDFVQLKVDKNSWIYARKYFDKIALVFINNSPSTKKFEINLPDYLIPVQSFNSVFQYPFSLINQRVLIELPRYSAEILIN
ncbi:MAG TPA: alpha-amylase family glycosyl hydrolase [Paludibacteraceae bacterium]|nr:alpha-amylase family glycosyl hydrolase [Paludibacteraceae bacterium]